ncbi:MAG: TSUP family transporter, partial [Gammaproteobacteria bacterium]|nr:TSUP family transporter [Gammaproteobacteria bacterium]
PPHVALGTNKLQSVFGTAIATHSYYRHGWLQKQGLIHGLIYSFLGALLGANASQFVDSHLLRKIIPILLFGVLLYTIFLPKFNEIDKTPKMKQSIFFIIFGLLLGFYDGFLGPGTGSFWVFALIFFLGFNMTKATAYTKALNLNTNIAALVCFALGHYVDYGIGLCMAAGQLVGGRLGAHLAIKKGAKLIRPFFIAMVSITIIVILFK